MSDLKKYALIISMIEHLNTEGNWCGEIHIQKALYFIETLFPGKTNYKFILYKYSPFSFELRDDIGIMVAKGILKAKPMYPYGPRLLPGEVSEKIKIMYQDVLSKNELIIKFIAKEFTNKNVFDLEILATALYIIHMEKKEKVIERNVEKLIDMKPHIPFNTAKKAIEDTYKIISRAKMLK